METTAEIAIDPIMDVTVIKITTDHIGIVTIDTIIPAAIIHGDATTIGITIRINDSPDPASGAPGIHVAKLSVRV
jgi:hypothetical protein